MITDKQKQLLLDQLRKTPIIQLACEKTGISRMTYYRLRRESQKFKRAADEALAQGELLINDLSEGVLISLIKEKNFQAVSLWLKQHHPKYAARLEISGRIEHEDGNLSAKQKAIIKQALRLSMINKQNYYEQRKGVPKDPALDA